MAGVRFERADALLADEPLPARVRAVRGLATAHQLEGDVRYACFLLEKCVNELNAGGLPDPEALLLMYSTVITPYMDLGAYERATKAAGLALDLAPQVKDPVAIAGLHRAVARRLAARGRYEDAEGYLAEAQDLYQQRDIRSESAQCHWMHGYLHTQHGRLAEAEDELRTALTMLRETGGRSARRRSRSSSRTCGADVVTTPTPSSSWRACWWNSARAVARCTRRRPTGCSA